MADKNHTEIIEEETIETYEFTDENGVDHCFVVESRFKVGQDDYVALLEVDPSVFSEEEDCECGCDHDHGHAHNHEHEHTSIQEDEDGEDGPNIILAKIVEDGNGDVDIQVPSDEEFEQAKLVYESLDD